MWTCVFLVCVTGVFGVDADEVKSVMEGDSVTLHTHLTHIQTQDHILWMFGPQEKRIAEIHKRSIDMFDSNEIFGDRLKLDSQTGSLSITNIIITDSGLYKLHIISDRGTSFKRFSVTVYARLPVPVITRDSSQCSSSSERSSVSTCVLLCSVMNVTRVSLSWYKGKSLLSSISVSDLNIRLSLPLEVEYQDTNTYRCVVNNPITNHTQHLHITEICRPCSDSAQVPSFLYPVFLLSFVVFTICAILCCLYSKNQTGVKNETGEKDMSEYTEVIYRLHTRDPSQKSHQRMDRPVRSVTYQHTTQ
ncbi:natural killer cell receptor 2B4-like isoform X2 [Triplophysa rosa]|uniref:natural killer cell receptor 2B4-like isoform X2 n=1 Tax=Triplophysa rosa TaxID=992332 RepID=UPI002545D887|nr:natural killer cell receptor 2B4-like isoform X2 [Triplophysa rosa]